MKKSILLLLTFLVISCQKEKKVELETENNISKVEKISNLLKTDKLQKFEFVLKKDTVLTGKEGTKIFIPKDLFDNYTNGKITFELKEFYSKEDMILNGLSTITDKDELLESSGMFYVNFKEVGKQLTIKEGKDYKIEVSNEQLSDTNIYYNDNDSIFKWKLSDDKIFTEIPDIVRNFKLFLSPSWKYDNIPDKYFKKVELAKVEKVKKQDSIEYMRLLEIQDIKAKTQNVIEVNELDWDTALEVGNLTDEEKKIKQQKILNFYNTKNEISTFVSKKLGWINCDRLISPDKVIDFTILNKTNSESSYYSIYFVYKDLKSIIQYNYNDLNDLTIKSFKLKGSVKAIVVNNFNDNIYYDIFYLNANSKTNFEINLKETTLEKLKQELISQ